MTIKLCELCGGEAAVYCAADSAFLCIGCDDRVHAANFIVARHIRQAVCATCKSINENCGNGFCFESCTSSPSSSTSSLDCVSSCESSSIGTGERGRKPIGSRTSRKTKVRTNPGEAEAVFANWCAKLGFHGRFKNSVVLSACLAMSLCVERLTSVLPYKVILATSFWFGVKVSGGRPEAATWRNLKRVEEISGVPSRLIVAVEIRVARALRFRKSPVDVVEGSAENGNV